MNKHFALLLVALTTSVPFSSAFSMFNHTKHNEGGLRSDRETEQEIQDQDDPYEE